MNRWKREGVQPINATPHMLQPARWNGPAPMAWLDLAARERRLLARWEIRRGSDRYGQGVRLARAFVGFARQTRMTGRAA